MSETTTPIIPSTTPLVSSSPANQSTAAASGLSASGLMVILIWTSTSLFHIVIPPDVAAAMVGLIGTGVHWLMLKYGIPVTE